MQSRSQRWRRLWTVLALGLMATAGCELVVDFDRNLIDAGGDGATVADAAPPSDAAQDAADDAPADALADAPTDATDDGGDGGDAGDAATD